ncbi:hypothetical protein ACTMU2_17740 [Cupriavidus basilensis]
MVAILDTPSKYGIGIGFRPLAGADYRSGLSAGSCGAMQRDTTYQTLLIGMIMNVLRFGLSYDLNEKWTIRAGYMTANAFADSNHTLANFYANGITHKAVTAGFTYAFDKKNSLTFAFEYDIPKTLVGTGVSTGTNISTNSQWYTLGYTHKF